MMAVSKIVLPMRLGIDFFSCGLDETETGEFAVLVTALIQMPPLQLNLPLMVHSASMNLYRYQIKTDVLDR